MATPTGAGADGGAGGGDGGGDGGAAGGAAREAGRGALAVVLVFVLVLAGGIAGMGHLTDGFTAWTLDDRRAARVAGGTMTLAPLDIRNQHGERARLFAVDPAVGVDAPRFYIVDFFYTRCPTVCRALGAEFARLQRRLADDGVGGAVRLVSLSIDPGHDNAAALGAYAATYRATTPGWQVAAPAASASSRRYADWLRAADIVAIPDGLGGFEHNGEIHVTDAQGRVLALFPLTAFDEARRFVEARLP
jgi:protein SCO1/2